MPLQETPRGGADDDDAAAPINIPRTQNPQARLTNYATLGRERPYRVPGYWEFDVAPRSMLITT